MARNANTGYLGDLSEFQETVMREVLVWVKENQVLDLDALLFDETDILRFCRARKFDAEKVKVMI